MKLKDSSCLPYKYLLIFILILNLSACTKKHVKQPVVKVTLPQKVILPEKATEERPDLALTDILILEAEKFLFQKKYQDALFNYNQALARADSNQKPKIIKRIESALSQTPAKDIKEFSYIKNIIIPRSLLLYWLGLNHATQGNKLQSKEAFEKFIFEYPGHPYYSDALDLIHNIESSLFKRNTIGCLLPLTGKYAIFGKRALKGIQVAVQQLSDKYSQEFNIIIKDTQADPQVAIEAVKQLHQENVAGIIGPLLTVQQAGQEAEKLGIPMIALTQKSEFPLQGDYLFSNFITPQMQVQTLGAYLFLKLGIKKVAILYPDEKYGKKYMELFWDVVDEYGGNVVGVESYDGKNTDFKEPIQKLTGEFYQIPEILNSRDRNPVRILSSQSEIDQNKRQQLKNDEKKIKIDFQALFIPDSPSKINLILPQLAFYDAKGMYIVGTNLWNHKSILKNSKGYNKHAIITDGFFDNSQNKLTMDFTKKFESLFSIKPKFLEAISYDNTSILFLTAMDKTIESRSGLMKALKGSRIYEGVTGSTIFDKDGAAHRELFLITIKNSEFVEISR